MERSGEGCLIDCSGFKLSGERLCRDKLVLKTQLESLLSNNSHSKQRKGPDIHKVCKYSQKCSIVFDHEEVFPVFSLRKFPNCNSHLRHLSISHRLQSSVERWRKQDHLTFPCLVMLLPSMDLLNESSMSVHSQGQRGQVAQGRGELAQHEGCVM